MANESRRRELHFDSLSQAVEHCEHLLNVGYEPKGNWSLGQICEHLTRTIEASMDGYPRWMVLAGLPLRPFLRRWLLPKLLAGKSPSGIKTAPMFQPPSKIDDAAAVRRFRDTVERFHAATTPPHPHPGFGKMDRATLERFHAAHAAHHLSFLWPRTEPAPVGEGRDSDVGGS